MNRLILIGNGFDLAHGLKTSYKDFVFWYLDDCFNKAGIYSTTPFENEFVYIKVLDHHRLMSLVHMLNNQSFCSFLYNKGILHMYLNPELNEDVSHFTQEQKSKLSNILSHEVNFKSDFFKHLIFCCTENNWVDIENEYFEQLKKCKNKEGVFDFEKVNQLNKELQFLKGKLEEYLKTQQKDVKIKFNDKLVKLINAKFELSDFDTVVDYKELRGRLGYIDGEKKEEHNLHILNFNYTDTFDVYKPYIKQVFPRFDVNYIHGELGDPENPIIFGFGDEHDKEYSTFEEQGNNELFTHIKSYRYFNTPNYRNLVRFLNSGNFQVYIMGHSCGLSDRTMFKEIFDHENCKSVKIFHYAKNKDENDFWEKTVNLGRHFSDKGRMRKLIVEYKETDAFPQNTVNVDA